MLQPIPRASGPRPQAAHLATLTPLSTLSPQGPAGKDGEAGAQGPPGPAVSVPHREAWGGGTMDQERGSGPLPPFSWAFP